MQALKGLVVGMAILIVAGMVLLVYGLYQKAQDPSFSFFAAKAPAAAPAPAGPSAPAPSAPATAPSAPATAPSAPATAVTPGPAQSFGAVSLALPAGSSVRGLLAVDGRLVVQVAVPSEPERLLLLDPRSGAVLGQWTLGPPP